MNYRLDGAEGGYLNKSPWQQEHGKLLQQITAKLLEAKSKLISMSVNSRGWAT